MESPHGWGWVLSDNLQYLAHLASSVLQPEGEFLHGVFVIPLCSKDLFFVYVSIAVYTSSIVILIMLY